MLIAIDASLQCVRRPTQAFIMAFQHFAARQGLPSVVYINNAFTFKRTSKDLRGIRNVLRNLRFQDHCTQHCFKRKFMAEREVWQGGFWERIEKTVKRCLQLTLEKKKKKRFGFKEMPTILQEVEAIVNTRHLPPAHDTPHTRQRL